MDTPKYYYRRNMGSYNIYKRLENGDGEKVFDHWDEEVVRKRCYELNGWEYKPKAVNNVSDK